MPPAFLSQPTDRVAHLAQEIPPLGWPCGLQSVQPIKELRAHQVLGHDLRAISDHACHCCPAPEPAGVEIRPAFRRQHPQHEGHPSCGWICQPVRGRCGPPVPERPNRGWTDPKEPGERRDQWPTMVDVLQNLPSVSATGSGSAGTVCSLDDKVQQHRLLGNGVQTKSADARIEISAVHEKMRGAALALQPHPATVGMARQAIAARTHGIAIDLNLAWIDAVVVQDVAQVVHPEFHGRAVSALKPQCGGKATAVRLLDSRQEALVTPPSQDVLRQLK